MQTLISSTTAAATGDFKCSAQDNQLPCTIIANGLGAAESIALQVSGDNGATYSAAFDYSAGTAIVFDSTHNTVRLDSPGTYRIVKPTTAAPVGVAISTATSA